MRQETEATQEGREGITTGAASKTIKRETACDGLAGDGLKVVPEEGRATLRTRRASCPQCHGFQEYLATVSSEGIGSLKIKCNYCGGGEGL